MRFLSLGSIENKIDSCVLIISIDIHKDDCVPRSYGNRSVVNNYNCNIDFIIVPKCVCERKVYDFLKTTMFKVDLCLKCV